MAHKEKMIKKENSENRRDLLCRLPVLWGILSLIFLCWSTTAPAKSGDPLKPALSEKVSQKKILKKHNIKKNKPVSQGVQAKAFYCVNPSKNETLMERNPDQSMPVASLTKLVTALVVLDHMRLDRKVTVPDHIKTIPKSVVGLKPGDNVSVEDLLHGLLIGSGNDCAETLACAFTGGKQKFVESMNKKVSSLGNQRTFFFTPSGLDRKNGNEQEAKNSGDVDFNVSTAREMAQIARIAFSNKTIRSISLKKSHIIASNMNKTGYHVKTTNKLLRDNLPLIGGKTGYTSRAGHCLASEFISGHDIVLIVVLGSPDHFRDTRLVYRTALKKTKAATSPQAPGSKRVAAN